MTNIIGCDLSHYESPVDFVKMKAAGAKFAFIKVGQWDFIDYDFRTLWFNAKGILPRGGYWFYDKRATPESQAELWIESMNGDYGELPLVADFEGIFYGGGEIANFKIFLERVQELAPRKEIMIYTGYYFWEDDSGYNANYADFFKQFDLWIAAYQTSTPRIPLPWTEWIFHQYDDKGSGAIWGTGGGSVDLNYFNGDEDEFAVRFNITLPDPPIDGDTKLLASREYFPGAIEKTYEITTPHGKAKYNLTELETAKVNNFFVSPSLPARTYVPTFLKNYDLHFAVNCGGWTSPPLVPTGYHSSDGQPYGQIGNEETVYIGIENIFSLTRPINLWNAFSFQNRLVKDGIIPVINKATNDIRARTAMGYDKEQTKVYLFTCDGGDQYSTDGLNFQEVAAVLLKLGCYQAFMLDGGGSTAKAVNDNETIKVIGKTSGEDIVAGYEYPLRRVLNIFGVVMDGVSIPEGDEMDEYLVLLDPTPRAMPDMYETRTLAKLKPGTKFIAMAEKTITVLDPQKPLNMGVKFIQIEASKYWVPERYQQKDWVKKIGVVEPPLSPRPVKAVITYSDGSAYMADSFIKE